MEKSHQEKGRLTRPWRSSASQSTPYLAPVLEDVARKDSGMGKKLDAVSGLDRVVVTSEHIL